MPFKRYLMQGMRLRHYSYIIVLSVMRMIGQKNTHLRYIEVVLRRIICQKKQSVKIILEDLKEYRLDNILNKIITEAIVRICTN